MTNVISIKFKPCGKHYFFAPPEGQTVEVGQKVVVETAKGLEIAECAKGVKEVDDELVIQPLRPVVRIATDADLKTLENNKQLEKDAFGICQKKIEEHELDMKLVDVECNFECSKITFFFTSDGRVDFRELVKDLASAFHTRIELRQIGVRDEAKMIGGIGICGRPYCCKEFLDDFASVSTKMAKVQNLSLNPAKISGSCGRLMCCLRYEEEAYEELTSNVPKVGAFVETPDGYGNATSVDILRQKVKVKLDNDSEDLVREFPAKAVAAVPGGRPKSGEKPVHVLSYTPDEEEKSSPVEEKDSWNTPSYFVEDTIEDVDVTVDEPSSGKPADEKQNSKKGGKYRYHRYPGKNKKSGSAAKKAKK